MSRKDEIEGAAKAFHLEHPDIWRLFVRFTNEAINRGFQNYSVNSIFERIRWETDMGGDGEIKFKLNNNYRPYYARWFMNTRPQYAGFFRTRELVSKHRAATDLPELGPEYYRQDSNQKESR